MRTYSMLAVVAVTSALGITACDSQRDYSNQPDKSGSQSEFGQKMEQGADRAGQAVSDSTITTKVKAAIVAEPGLSVFDIDVDTKQGVVTLSGAVGSGELKDRAEEITRRVEGVQVVRNELNVQPDTAG